MSFALRQELSLLINNASKWNFNVKPRLKVPSLLMRRLPVMISEAAVTHTMFRALIKDDLAVVLWHSGASVPVAIAWLPPPPPPPRARLGTHTCCVPYSPSSERFSKSASVAFCASLSVPADPRTQLTEFLWAFTAIAQSTTLPGCLYTSG